MDDFENSHSEKDFDINNLSGDDKIWVPLMLGFIFGATSKNWDDPKDKKDNSPS
jgi:hypothetical protein